MINTKLRVGDVVKVMAGSHKEKQGPIINFSKDRKRVFIKDITVTKHRKPSQQNEQGGIVQIPTSIDISNVALVDPKDKNKVTKIGFKITNNKKERIAKRSKVVLKGKKIIRSN